MSARKKSESEEIVRALWCEVEQGKKGARCYQPDNDCATCPYYYEGETKSIDELMTDAADSIKTLQTELLQKTQDLEAAQRMARAAVEDAERASCMWQKCLSRLCYACYNGNPSSQVKHAASCELCPWRGTGEDGEESK